MLQRPHIQAHASEASLVQGNCSNTPAFVTLTCAILGVGQHDSALPRGFTLTKPGKLFRHRSIGAAILRACNLSCSPYRLCPIPQTVLGIILGGGAGSRLYPLTKTRAKPAVPLGANYRLIDIPVSNCINSGVNKIYCLTQFNSASLNRHLSSAYVRLQSAPAV